MSVQRICADREIWNNGFSYNKQVGLRSLRHLPMGHYCWDPLGAARDPEARHPRLPQLRPSPAAKRQADLRHAEGL